MKHSKDDVQPKKKEKKGGCLWDKWTPLVSSRLNILFIISKCIFGIKKNTALPQTSISKVSRLVFIDLDLKFIDSKVKNITHHAVFLWVR